jgi:hypothetical protein
MLYKTLATLLLVVFCMGKANAQDSQLKVMEDSLVAATDSIYIAPIIDDRTEYNVAFVKMLVRTLKMPNSYNYPFTKLQEKINIMTSPDKRFRIFNWMVMTSDVTVKYYGAIQMPGEQLKLYGLEDISTTVGKSIEDTVLTGGKWIGALYYNILPQDVDGQIVYTLLGVNASNNVSKKKFMEPLTFTAQGPVFGAPIFNIRSKAHPSARINRYVMEYKKEVQASLNWDKEMNMIYMDKLVSQVNDPNRKYTYVPSGEYDGFKWSNGAWNLVENLIPIDALKDGQAPVPVPAKGRVE